MNQDSKCTGANKDSVLVHEIMTNSALVREIIKIHYYSYGKTLMFPLRFSFIRTNEFLNSFCTVNCFEIAFRFVNFFFSIPAVNMFCQDIFNCNHCRLFC